MWRRRRCKRGGKERVEGEEREQQRKKKKTGNMKVKNEEDVD